MAQDGSGFLFDACESRDLQSAVCTLRHQGLLVSTLEPRQGIEGRMGVPCLGCQHEVVPHGKRQKHIGFLVAAAQALQRQAMVRPTRDRLTFEPQLAAASGYVTTEQMGEGGFARTIGANDGMDLVFVQRQRYVIDRQQTAKAFA